MITRKDIASQLTAQVKAGFLKGKSSYMPKRSAFCGTAQSQGAFEVYADMISLPWPGNEASPPLAGDGGIGTLNTADIQQVGNLSDVPNIRIVDGGEESLQVFNKDWPIGIGVSFNAINDGNVSNLESWATGVAIRYEQHKDFLAFDALANGDTSKYAVGSNGKPLFANDHVYPKAYYKTAQDNLYALALDQTNHDIVVTAGGSFVDEWGQPLGRYHNTLIVAQNLRYAAAQIADNPQKSGTTDTINPYNGEVQLVVAPGGYLPASFWACVDSSLPQKPIMLQERQAPQLIVHDDPIRQVRFYLWSSRYTVFYADWSLAIKGGSS